jgi:hypothetical protein
MSETLIRDQLELERQRDAFTRLDRINGAERDVAVLKTRFEAFSETIIKELARSVSQEDLKEIRREMLATKREFSAELAREVEKMHMEFEKSNEAWAEKIITGSQMQRLVEQKQMQRQMALTVFGAAMSLGAGLIMFWITTGRA